MTTRTCRNCGEEFIARPGKPGFINQCEDCAHDVPLLGGNMIWDHKTAPSLVIRPLADAQFISKLQKRVGTGVIRSIVSVKH